MRAKAADAWQKPSTGEWPCKKKGIDAQRRGTWAQPPSNEPRCPRPPPPPTCMRRRRSESAAAACSSARSEAAAASLWDTASAACAGHTAGASHAQCSVSAGQPRA